MGEEQKSYRRIILARSDSSMVETHALQSFARVRCELSFESSFCFRQFGAKLESDSGFLTASIAVCCAFGSLSWRWL